MNKTLKWFSFRRVFPNSFHLGIGIGWDKTDRTGVLLFWLGPCLATVGPHYPAPIVKEEIKP